MDAPVVVYYCVRVHPHPDPCCPPEVHSCHIAGSRQGQEVSATGVIDLAVKGEIGRLSSLWTWPELLDRPLPSHTHI